MLLSGRTASATHRTASSSTVLMEATSLMARPPARCKQSASSVYLAIGNAIPTPAPETLEEVRVNASMYDAQQGSASGAHIDMSTGSGTNVLHGSGYFRRGTDWINAAPFFFKQDESIPASEKLQQLHRYTAGGTFGR